MRVCVFVLVRVYMVGMIACVRLVQNLADLILISNTPTQCDLPLLMLGVHWASASWCQFAPMQFTVAPSVANKVPSGV